MPTRQPAGRLTPARENRAPGTPRRRYGATARSCFVTIRGSPEEFFLSVAPTHDQALHRFLVFLAGVTFLLLIAGALVTSNQAGLAVPDWPTSFGHLFKIPPMVGGIKYEHGHRMLAEFVGLLTIVAAFWTQFTDKRSWMRKLGWIALVLVIVQGVLGGITVKMFLPWYVSTAHAAVAQTFFSLVVLMALFTSRGWMEGTAAAVADSGKPSLWALSLLSLSALYLQLFFGGAFRHSGMSILPHILNALVVLGVLIWTSVRGMIEGRQIAQIKTPARLVHALLMLQILLGVAAYYTRVKDADAPQPLPGMIATTVAHVGVGALLLASTFVLAIRTRRYFPAPVAERSASHREAAA
jgi:cytochrome c oxidase assembly protein subunit 15